MIIVQMLFNQRVNIGDRVLVIYSIALTIYLNPMAETIYLVVQCCIRSIITNRDPVLLIELERFTFKLDAISSV